MEVFLCENVNPVPFNISINSLVRRPLRGVLVKGEYTALLVGGLWVPNASLVLSVLSLSGHPRFTSCDYGVYVNTVVYSGAGYIP